MYIKTNICFVIDISTLHNHILSYKNRQLNHMHNVQTVDSKLQQEIKQYNDIVVTPGVDVYRRLPNKLIYFIHW